MVSNEFVPSYQLITGISNAQQAVITCSSTHDYSDGEIVSFRVSPNYGMKEINNKQGKILSHTNNTITVDIDTTTWTAFVYPPVTTVSKPLQFLAMVVPSASGIVPDSNPKVINIQDAFDNVRTN